MSGWIAREDNYSGGWRVMHDVEGQSVTLARDIASESDARLIAAAPALLEALHVIRITGPKREHDIAAEAIAKALFTEDIPDEDYWIIRR